VTENSLIEQGETEQWETQRERVPLVDTGELDTTLAFLDFARSCVLKKTTGLTEEQLRRPVVPSGTSLLGLVQHLIDAERFWFGYQLGGIGDEDDFTFSMQVSTDRRPEQVWADYRAAIEDSNALCRRLGDPATLMAQPLDGERKSMRWVIAHMVGETTRHAGHADILRELIDGITGR